MKNKISTKDQFIKLRDQIKKYNNNYYNFKPDITDAVYDELKLKYEETLNNDSLFKKFDNKQLAHDFINDDVNNNVNNDVNDNVFTPEINNEIELPSNFANNKINYVYTDGSCVNNGKENAKAGSRLRAPMAWQSQDKEHVT